MYIWAHGAICLITFLLCIMKLDICATVTDALKSESLMFTHDHH